MKKCQGCHREIDKYAIACDYCGRVAQEHDKKEAQDNKPKNADKKSSRPDK